MTRISIVPAVVALGAVIIGNAIAFLSGNGSLVSLLMEIVDASR